MHEFRKGDRIALEALVVSVNGDRIEIAISDGSVAVSPADLTMVKRSFHPDDEVTHKGAAGIIRQSLEDGVFLVCVDGAVGADAYRVVNEDELEHANSDQGNIRTLPVGPRPAPVAAKMSQTLHKDPATSKAPEARHEAPAPAKTNVAAAMAATLTGRKGGDQGSGGGLDLEGLGVTREVDAVGKGDELLLDDDMQVRESDQS